MTEPFNPDSNSITIKGLMNQIILGHPDQQPAGVRDLKVTDFKMSKDGESVSGAFYPKNDPRNDIEMQFFKKRMRDTGMDGDFRKENIRHNYLFTFSFPNNKKTLDFLKDTLTRDIITSHTNALRDETGGDIKRMSIIMGEITKNLKKSTSRESPYKTKPLSKDINNKPVDKNSNEAIIERHTAELRYMEDLNGGLSKPDIIAILERIAEELKVTVEMERHTKAKAARQQRSR